MSEDRTEGDVIPQRLTQIKTTADLLKEIEGYRAVLEAISNRTPDRRWTYSFAEGALAAYEVRT